LPQQEPQEGVADLKSSVASSDEERLAAGISMIALQTKRLSGAQRKKAYQRRKMREGTWMEKHPGKTPSSQDKGAEGSSGGVKKPHSDSCTPSLEKQQPKTSRNTQVQTGSYKETIVKAASVVYPSLRVQTRPKPLDFFKGENPQRTFLRKGSTAVCPMSQDLRQVKDP
jgi:hypothetical protein